MASGSIEMNKNGLSSTSSIVVGEELRNEVVDDKNKTCRHPRWTRPETLVLIEGKKIAEDRRRGCGASSVLDCAQIKPKWDLVSSYCKQNGVNRGPVQCRKRWSNLISDFKKIRTWELQVKEERDSYWMMMNDLRKVGKLPGFFDREIYDVLEGKAFIAAEHQLAVVTLGTDANTGNHMETGEGGDEVQDNGKAQQVLGSGHHKTADSVNLSDFEPTPQWNGDDSTEEGITPDKPTITIPSPVSISEKNCQPLRQACPYPGTAKGEQSGSHFWKGPPLQKGVKRRRLFSDCCENSNLEDCLAKVMERNSNMLNAELEARNMNVQLDREQCKEQSESLVAALNKIGDALVRIADKL
ncbi:PREDICTED: trihelix transcription factor ASR3-like isoform X2 [Ipomoea nil]|uniref:trihelix transcription factor ASR3-like isoform X2 n=1 Tax=Ipomoea nil TaxID=35883 RepID=UPI000900E418|nr:PREDICTED: trihelix transcription factor ASR3-like isoform X2 [Ipomoea nil]